MQILINKKYDAISVTSTVTTEAVYCPNAETVAYVVAVTNASTPGSATIQIQGSLDGVNFHSLDTTSSISANGVAGSHVANQDTAFLYYRLRYVIVSGSYTASTRLVCKGQEL